MGPARHWGMRLMRIRRRRPSATPLSRAACSEPFPEQAWPGHAETAEKQACCIFFQLCEPSCEQDQTRRSNAAHQCLRQRPRPIWKHIDQDVQADRVQVAERLDTDHAQRLTGLINTVTSAMQVGQRRPTTASHTQERHPDDHQRHHQRVHLGRRFHPHHRRRIQFYSYAWPSSVRRHRPR